MSGERFTKQPGSSTSDVHSRTATCDTIANSLRSSVVDNSVEIGKHFSRAHLYVII